MKARRKIRKTPKWLATMARAIATRVELGPSAELIAACPKLEIISVYGVGFDAVHLDSC